MYACVYVNIDRITRLLCLFLLTCEEIIFYELINSHNDNI